MEVLFKAAGHVGVWFLYSMESLAMWFCHASAVSGDGACKATLSLFFTLIVFFLDVFIRQARDLQHGACVIATAHPGGLV